MSPVSGRQSSTHAVNTRVQATLDTHSLPTTNTDLAIEDIRTIADELRDNDVVEILYLDGA